MHRFAALIVVVAAAWGFASAAEDKGTLVGIDGQSSRTPGDWKEVEASLPNRYKQFTLPRAGGDTADAELIVYFFGTGQGGSSDANVKRWKGQFQPPEGKKIDDVAKLEEFKVGDTPVTYLDVQGTYLFKARPFDPNEKPQLRPHYRMIGVIFESAKGPYFIKLVGPEKTVAQHKKGFDEWLKNFK